jgi:hypothetical protein
VLLVVVLGVGAAAAVWFGMRRPATSAAPAKLEPLGAEAQALVGAEAQALVGKWTFVEGTIKSNWEIPSAPQKHEVPLAGKYITVSERDGALWAAMQDDRCSVLLARKAKDAAEVVSARTDCPADAGPATKGKSIQVALSVDANGLAHVTWTSRFSLTLQGVVHDGYVDYTGVAEKQADAVR